MTFIFYMMDAVLEKGFALNLATRLTRAISAPPADAPALHHPSGSLTRAELSDRVTSWHAWLAPLNTGSRVGVVCHNHPDDVAALLAVLGSGRCLVPLSGLLPPGVRQVIADTARLDLLLDPGTHPARPGNRPHSNPGGPPLGPDATVVELRSSGTTGHPQPVEVSARQLAAALAGAGQDRPAQDPSAATVVVHPIEHVAGFTTLLGAVLAGRSIVLLPRFEPSSWAEAVHRHRARGGFLMPAALRALLEQRISVGLLASLAFVSTGPSDCPSDLAEAFGRTFGIPVLSTYGATEFAGAVAGWGLELHREWWPAKAGSAGRAYPGIELRVIDDQGSPARPDTPGRLEVRACQLHDDGQWEPTNDRARLDTDGFLWVLGRLDQVILRGGFKVHPERIERALQQHPRVAEASAFGVPDERLGAVPEAAVKLRHGAGGPSTEELLQCWRHLLAPYEVPRRIHLLPLPRTGSGKVSRRAVSELLGAGHAF